MAKEYYIRRRVAGRYVKVVRYSRTLPNDSAAARKAKRTATTAAQKFINVKNATEKLQLLLCANFDSKDACFCTFTFRDDQLPANQKHARLIFRDFLNQLRKEWHRHSRELRYIYTVEGDPLSLSPSAAAVSSLPWEITPWREQERWAQMDDQTAQDDTETSIRLHVHCFLLLQKEDCETVKALWPHGQVYINAMKVNELTTFQRLAAYVTKEKRTDATGKSNGSRAYIPSLNLEQPVTDGHWCADYEGIQLPKGAEEIRSGSERDDVYGTSMEYILYRLPRPQQVPQPYKSKGRLQKKGRRKRPK